MNEAKISRIESGLNGMAKKVLDAVPAQSPWSKDQIAIEIRRRGSGADRAVLDGCLDSLRGRGLIKEPTRGQFIRVVGKITTKQPEEDITVTNQVPPARPAPEKKDSLSRLAELAKTLRSAADQIDAVALDVEERVQTIEKDTDKLRQLQVLLKSIGQQ
jgi:hypothetical protein